MFEVFLVLLCKAVRVRNVLWSHTGDRAHTLCGHSELIRIRNHVSMLRSILWHFTPCFRPREKFCTALSVAGSGGGEPGTSTCGLPGAGALNDKSKV